MRTLIIMACCAAVLTACRTPRQTVENSTQQAEYQSTETRVVHHVDSINLMTLVHVDSVEIALVRPDSTCVFIRARGVHGGQQKVEMLQLDYTDTLQTGTSTQIKKEIAVRQSPSFTKAIFILISLIILTFTICRLCKH